MECIFLMQGTKQNKCLGCLKMVFYSCSILVLFLESIVTEVFVAQQDDNTKPLMTWSPKMLQTCDTPTNSSSIVPQLHTLHCTN